MTAGGLVALGGEPLERADELLDRANHDVAKYMSMTARNVDPEAVDEELSRLILRDLERTFAGRSAWGLWADASGELAELAEDPELAEIDGGMERLSELAARFAAGQGRARPLIELTLELADRIKALRLAVRRRLIEERRR